MPPFQMSPTADRLPTFLRYWQRLVFGPCHQAPHHAEDEIQPGTRKLRRGYTRTEREYIHLTS